MNGLEPFVSQSGVSNYGVAHIQEFVDARKSSSAAAKKPELPVLNQVDLHPFMRRQAIVDICEKNEIILEVRRSPDVCFSGPDPPVSSGGRCSSCFDVNDRHGVL